MSRRATGHEVWCCCCRVMIPGYDRMDAHDAHHESADHKAAFRQWVGLPELETSGFATSNEEPEVERCGACGCTVSDWWTHRRSLEHVTAVALYLAKNPIDPVLAQEIRMSLRERPPLHQTCFCGSCDCCEIEDRITQAEHAPMFASREGA